MRKSIAAHLHAFTAVIWAANAIISDTPAYFALAGLFLILSILYGTGRMKDGNG